MNILVIGSGGREHAIAWKLAGSPRVKNLFVAPGNGGTAAIATTLPIPVTDIQALARAAQEHAIDLTVVGPEASLAAGLVDHFQSLGLRAFGPTKAAARIESSKAFAKELMERHGVPTAPGRVFEDYHNARRYLLSHSLPVVVKADGLAAGKGVTVAETRDEALRALEDSMVRRIFGPAGGRVVIEERLHGQEVSVFTFTDGEHVSSLVAARDYKRANDGDLGPNTGGMGSYSPPEFWTPALAIQIKERIFQPVLAALAGLGTPYRGVLYAGLMLTDKEPQVLEFNCRLGDPEAQVILPRLKTDLVDAIEATLSGDLPKVTLEWSEAACVGVVVASQGYPGPYGTGFPIHGLDNGAKDVLVFHAGTSLQDGRLVTAGGRVLTVVGTGDTLTEARARAYGGLEGISFQGAFYRQDIALGAVKVGG